MLFLCKSEKHIYLLQYNYLSVLAMYSWLHVCAKCCGANNDSLVFVFVTQAELSDLITFAVKSSYLVLSGTISRMTVKRMANQVSGSVLANDYT